jgi:hypothetical protein
VRGDGSVDQSKEGDDSDGGSGRSLRRRRRGGRVPFLCYANGDIMFEDSLAATAAVIAAYAFKASLAVGVRTKYVVRVRAFFINQSLRFPLHFHLISLLITSHHITSYVPRRRRAHQVCSASASASASTSAVLV